MLVKHVFDLNNYPFILSIETHCSTKQNEIAAKILKDELGSKLYILPPNYSEFKKYPSPNQLQNRIILTGRIACWTIEESDEIAIKNNVLDSIENELQQVQAQDEILSRQKKKNINIFLTQKRNLSKPKLKCFLDQKNVNGAQNDDSDPEPELQKIDSPRDTAQDNKILSQQAQSSSSQNKAKIPKNKMVRDLSGFKNSDGLQKIFSMYTHSINLQKQPSLWEIYEMNL